MSEAHFFQNKACPYFPCHEVESEDDFNCLFCYCPLYALGEKCGGNFYWNERGIKVCTNCSFVHKKKNFDEVILKVKDVVEMIRKQTP